MSTRTQLDALMTHIQEMWGHIYVLFEDLNDSDGWDQMHGPDWNLADVPYHLTYCNCDIIARGIKLGPDYPEEERELLAIPKDINAWNARKMGDRPFYQRPDQSVSRWQASCEAIYALTLRMNDADLDRPFWMPHLQGWVTARDGLEFCRNHDWGHFTQLRTHMRHAEPVPSPVITRGYLGTWINSIPILLNQAAADGQVFTTVLAFTDPGVGAWTIRLADGAATVSEGQAAQADLVITHSAEAFEKSICRVQNPVEAILSGELRFNNFENLITFGQLFPVK